MDLSGYSEFLLEIAGSAVASASGLAELVFEPSHTNEIWSIETQRVTNAGPSIPQVLVYNTVVGAVGFIEGTRNGIFASSNTLLRVLPGETLLYEWSNCTPGTTCTVILRGSRYVAL